MSKSELPEVTAWVKSRVQNFQTKRAIFDWVYVSPVPSSLKMLYTQEVEKPNFNSDRIPLPRTEDTLILLLETVGSGLDL